MNAFKWNGRAIAHDKLPSIHSVLLAHYFCWNIWIEYNKLFIDRLSWRLSIIIAIDYPFNPSQSPYLGTSLCLYIANCIWTSVRRPKNRYLRHAIANITFYKSRIIAFSIAFTILRIVCILLFPENLWPWKIRSSRRWTTIANGAIRWQIPVFLSDGKSNVCVF